MPAVTAFVLDVRPASHVQPSVVAGVRPTPASCDPLSRPSGTAPIPTADAMRTTTIDAQPSLAADAQPMVAAAQPSPVGDAQPSSAADAQAASGAEDRRWRVCCVCNRPWPLDQFRRVDRTSGRRAHQCRACHAERERLRGRMRRKKRRGESIDRFVRAMNWLQQRRRIETAALMAIDRFGGPDKFAAMIVEHARRTEIGSIQHLEILLAVKRMELFALEEKRAKQDDEDLGAVADLVTEEDVDRNLRGMLISFIQSTPEIAIDAALRLGWKITPVAEEHGQPRGKREPLADISVDEWTRACM